MRCRRPPAEPQRCQTCRRGGCPRDFLPSSQPPPIIRDERPPLFVKLDEVREDAVGGGSHERRRQVPIDTGHDRFRRHQACPQRRHHFFLSTCTVLQVLVNQ